MDSERSSTGTESPQKRLSRHSSAFSLSFSFRSPGKRGSIIVSPKMPPDCLESVHYPVFDPQDPEHNSQLRRVPHRLDPRPASPVSLRRTHKTSTFPRRSLLKARSGLLAFTSSLFHRTSHQDSDLLGSESRSPKQRHARRNTHGFSDISSSTQEDLSFGIDLYRTGRSRPRTLDDPDVNAIGRVPSFHPLQNTISAPQPMTSSCTLVHESQPVVSQNVYTSAEAPSPHASYSSSAAKFNLQVDEAGYTGQELAIVERILNKPAARLNSTVTSGDQHAAETSPSSSTGNEDTSGTSLLCDDEDAALGHEERLSKAFMDCEGPTCRKIEELRNFSEERNALSSDMVQNHSDSKESLPDYSTPSIPGSEVYQPRRSTGISPEILVTRESLLLEDDSLESQANESPVSESSKGSAEVRIAFPGLYRELLEQWTRETEVNHMPQPGLPGLENERPSSAGHLPSFPTDTNSHHNQGNRPHPSKKSLWSANSRFDSGYANSRDDLQKEKTLVTYTSLSQPRAVTVHCMQDSVALTGNMDDYTRQPETQTPRSREVQSNQRRHSFGLHISTRYEPTSRPSSIQVSRRRVLQRSSEDEHNPFHDRHIFSPSSLWGAADSQFDDSDISTNLTRDTSAVSSANYTSPTSTSSPPWSAMNSPIDEEALFRATHRDEYYMADGKHSSYHPDRGDLPVKGERFADNRRGYYNPENVGPSSRLRLMTRVGSSHNAPRSFRPEVQGSEEQDEDEPTEGMTPGSQAPA